MECEVLVNNQKNFKKINLNFSLALLIIVSAVLPNLLKV